MSNFSLTLDSIALVLSIYFLFRLISTNTKDTYSNQIIKRSLLNQRL